MKSADKILQQQKKSFDRASSNGDRFNVTNSIESTRLLPNQNFSALASFGDDASLSSTGNQKRDNRSDLPL